MKPIPSVTPHLTREIVQTCLIHLPTKVGLFERETATKCLIDSLACAFAAYKESPIENLKHTLFEHASTQGCSVIGYPEQGRSDDVALINGTMISLQLFDDNQAQMRGHPSGPLLPAVLAVAEEVNASLTDALNAFVVGYELECRLGVLLNPSHYEQGWHATATQGAFGAVMASAILMRLSTEQMLHAFGIVASMASGIRRNFGTMTMSLHSGIAASNGVKAAKLAARGFTADPEIFEGRMNIGQVLSKDWVESKVLMDLPSWGQPFMITSPGPSLKLYPCGRPPLFAVDCVVELQTKHRLKVSDIKSIVAEVSYMFPRTLIHSRPINGLQAKTSLEYCIASAFLDERPVLSSFTDEAVWRPEILALIDLITVSVPPQLSESHEAVRKAPFEQPVTLRVQTHSGHQFTETVAHHKGSPENPASHKDLDAKFFDCVGPWHSTQKMQSILEMAKEGQTLVRNLMQQLKVQKDQNRKTD
jgi:2-methylcitrate dehydratase PrpD